MTWMWIVWWAVAIGLFAVFERYALDHPNRQWTLSATMAYVGRQWPLSIGLLGALFGGLLVHFYWHFCPTF
jgi:hypothetical protein